MSTNRKLVRVYTPNDEPGFLGPDHKARHIVRGDFKQTDPFILLMDDMLDKKDEKPVGGEHPHAGFETVSLLLEGQMGDTKHKMKSGDFQIMTAGSGIVHTETIDRIARMRLLQMWLNLPKKDRWTTPRVQDLSWANTPKLSENGVSITLYSGTLAGLTSPIQNFVPLIVADITLEPSATTVLNIPADYNTFLYVLSGNAKFGEDEQLLSQDQVGWLNLSCEEGSSELKLMAGKEGIRFILYAGQPTGESIAAKGPFIGDNAEDIARLYQEYRQGKMGHIANVPEGQRILL
jgi:quercetin 2,3-dioxygenase